MQNNDDEKGANRSKKGLRRGYAVLMVICLLVAAVSIFWIIKYIIVVNKSAEDFNNLKNSYVQESVAASDTEKEAEASRNTEEALTEAEKAKQSEEAALAAEAERQALLEQYQVPEKRIDFEALQAEQNPDIYGWITIPDTQIDYPILQSEEELDYYLEHNIDGSTGLPGCIYTQMINSRSLALPE